MQYTNMVGYKYGPATPDGVECALSIWVLAQVQGLRFTITMGKDFHIVVLGLSLLPDVEMLKVSSLNRFISFQTNMAAFGSSIGVEIKLLSDRARDQGFEPGSRHYDFRDWVSPCSKSR